MLHGSYSMLLYDDDGQVLETSSISAGLDYPGVGPEHALLQVLGRVRYVSAGDEEALEALAECCRLEGILPALEPAHALFAARRVGRRKPGQAIADWPFRARRQGHAHPNRQELVSCHTLMRQYERDTTLARLLGARASPPSTRAGCPRSKLLAAQFRTR